jgi:hypothetical protein
MLELESCRRSAAADGFAPQVAQGAQFTPVGMAHGAGAALAFPQYSKKSVCPHFPFSMRTTARLPPERQAAS